MPSVAIVTLIDAAILIKAFKVEVSSKKPCLRLKR